MLNRYLNKINISFTFNSKSFILSAIRFFWIWPYSILATPSWHSEIPAISILLVFFIHTEPVQDRFSKSFLILLELLKSFWSLLDRFGVFWPFQICPSVITHLTILSQASTTYGPLAKWGPLTHLIHEAHEAQNIVYFVYFFHKFVCVKKDQFWPLNMHFIFSPPPPIELELCTPARRNLFSSV